jgi:hypothetical protein
MGLDPGIHVYVYIYNVCKCVNVCMYMSSCVYVYVYVLRLQEVEAVYNESKAKIEEFQDRLAKDNASLAANPFLQKLQVDFFFWRARGVCVGGGAKLT